MRFDRMLAGTMALGLATGAAPAPAAPSKPTPVDAQDWVTDEDYPPAALRAGTQGAVGVRLDLDRSGVVTGCAVTRSSGSAVLDGTTCDLLRARARFEPARDRRGRAVASTWRSRIRWVLPDDNAPPPQPGFPVTTIRVEPDGKVISCDTAGSGGAAGDDPVCGPVRSAEPPAWLAAYARDFGTLRLQAGWALDGGRPSAPDPAWGELIAERVSALGIDRDGTPVQCRVLAEHGPPAFRPDSCTLNRAALRTDAGAGGAAAATIVEAWALYGEPRRRP